MATVAETLTTSRGQQVEVRHSDQEAAEICLRSQSGFAVDLANQLRNTGRLSPRQRPWLHLLAQEQLDREGKARTEVDRWVGVLHGNLPQINALLRPRCDQPGRRLVSFESGEFGVYFNVPGRDHFHGQILLGGQVGRSEYLFGRIDADGNFYTFENGLGVQPAFLALLDEFEADPVAFAAAYGKRTGRCCFCRLSLTDERSIEEGYGPVCAQNYQLPWGNKRRTNVEQVE